MRIYSFNQVAVTSSTAESKPNFPRVDSSQGFEDLSPPEPLPLLVRATDGRSQSIDRKKNRDKVKLSTLVVPDGIEAFFSRYAETCRTNMQSLRKRDRSKRKNRRKKDNKKLDSTEGVAS